MPKSRPCPGCGSEIDYRNQRCWSCFQAKVRRRAWRCVDCSSAVATAGAYRCGDCGRREEQSFRAALRDGEMEPDERGRRRWTKRNRLDAQAPGYWKSGRRARLLAKWQKQGRRCTYCNGPAEQVDHVTPLARGGTNFEGNLAPACSACNYAKWDNFVSAWRHGRARKPPTIWVDISPQAPRLPRPKQWAQPEPLFAGTCAGCDNPVSIRAEFCSSRCHARVTYRRKVGIPDRAPSHSIREGRPTKRQEVA